METSVNQTSEVLARQLTSGRTLARSTLLHLLGQTLPLLFALAALPPVVLALGADRLGVVTLAWAAVGSFSLFDLGLGRALTQLISKSLGRGEPEDAPAFFWNSTFLILILGLVGTALLCLLAPWIVRRVLHIPPLLQRETLLGIYLLSSTLPAVIHTAGITGLLAAYQRFGAISALRLPMAAIMFLGPLAVLPFSQQIVPVLGTLVASRILGWLAHLIYCFWTIPNLRYPVRPSLSRLGPLLRFGTWMTVSNILSPVMVYLDRFMLGVLVPVSWVTFYSIPCEMVTKLSVVPGTVITVLFPAFATSFARDRDRTAVLYRRAVKYIFFALFPCVLIVITLAPEGLRLWLGGEFAVQGTPVVRWLAVGVLLNSLGYVPVGLLQGAGRPDLVAKLHSIEVPFYSVGLWHLTRRYGIEGAAAAWTFRMAVDSLALCYLVQRLGLARHRFTRHTALLAAGVVVLSFGCVPNGLEVRLTYLLLILILFLLLSWSAGLSTDERRFVVELFRRLRPNKKGPGTGTHPSPSSM